MIFSYNNIFAQNKIIKVIPEKTPEELVKNVFATKGYGSITNVTFKGICNSGANSSIGEFINCNTGNALFKFGFDRAILLTTGKAVSAVGPASDNASEDNELPGGDPDLNAMDPKIAQGKNISCDATVLEFDFIPDGDSVKFNYIFASEEYPGMEGDEGFVKSGYNDLFGLFISEPGVPGSAKNIALLKDGSTVGVQNVNDVIPKPILMILKIHMIF